MVICLVAITILREKNYKSEVYQFPVLEGVEDRTWESTIEFYQIPQKQLKRMSTSDLIETCVEYPLYDTSKNSLDEDVYEGFEQAIDVFNGLQELLTREDAGVELLEYYKNCNLDEWEKTKRKYLEYIIARDEILKSLSNSERKELSEIIQKHGKDYLLETAQLIVDKIAVMDYQDVIDGKATGEIIKISGNVLIEKKLKPQFEIFGMKQQENENAVYGVYGESVSFIKWFRFTFWNPAENMQYELTSPKGTINSNYTILYKREQSSPELIWQYPLWIDLESGQLVDRLWDVYVEGIQMCKLADLEILSVTKEMVYIKVQDKEYSISLETKSVVLVELESGMIYLPGDKYVLKEEGVDVYCQNQMTAEQWKVEGMNPRMVSCCVDAYNEEAFYFLYEEKSNILFPDLNCIGVLQPEKKSYQEISYCKDGYIQTLKADSNNTFQLIKDNGAEAEILVELYQYE